MRNEARAGARKEGVVKSESRRGKRGQGYSSFVGCVRIERADGGYWEDL
jgi:hypothetical protein